MKKNLISVIILALLVVNTILTAVMMFTVMPANKKTMELIGDISSAINLDMGVAGSGNVSMTGDSVAMSDIATYDIPDQMTIKLASDPDSSGNTAHYAVVSVTLSLNTKDPDYANYGGDDLTAKIGLIKDEINTVIGSYTFEQISTMDKGVIQQRILDELQTMYNSRFICGVSFSSWTLQ